jgi:hypothetical protein
MKVLKFEEYVFENNTGYIKWKKDNITYRGQTDLDISNKAGAKYGDGLYTVPLSNKSMAKEYGTVRYVLNAIPSNPVVSRSVNDAEIFLQNLIKDFCISNNSKYNKNFFNDNTTIEKEMLKKGYDGLIIKGREMVNYNPKNIKYFDNEKELEEYYNNLYIKESLTFDDIDKKKIDNPDNYIIDSVSKKPIFRNGIGKYINFFDYTVFRYKNNTYFYEYSNEEWYDSIDSKIKNKISVSNFDINKMKMKRTHIKNNI